ncbi:MAG: sodium:proton antiporter NhaD [Cyanobacteria bacterium NC_groundwater_1444_Ag_S-0.65um_54_12]|nr:sodium:proton antiporter NhaD [Cyanobacteria bacterium NC_groundwater_1444_Ag_S-0.65um_54_12]
MRLISILSLAAAMWSCLAAVAGAEQLGVSPSDLTRSWVGFTALGIFFLAYALAMGEEYLGLRKSKPVLVAAGIIWLLIGLAYAQLGDTHTAAAAVKHNLLEYGELFLFLLAAMTFINTLEERGVFDVLRAWLISRDLSLRALFWVTGLCAFFLSPIADNLTTALIMGAIVLAVGAGKPQFIVLSCINIVVAANAGGAFSPFGDITTLMVWQKGIIPFTGFFALFLPALINWLVPATLMSLWVEPARPEPLNQAATLHRGGIGVAVLFIFTIALAVAFHNFLHLPPVLGMMTGLGFLKIYGYLLKQTARPGNEMAVLVSEDAVANEPEEVFASSPFTEAPVDKPLAVEISETAPAAAKRKKLIRGSLSLGARAITGWLPRSGKPEKLDSGKEPFDVFKQLERSEWDTLIFFYGVIMSVGGLGTLGYLALTSKLLYGELGPMVANIIVGVLSAVIDNIPIMFAVLSMDLDMSQGQWLLVTLTAGVGGSLLSIGSAAGVALMGQARGIYTFMAHLKWTWTIALGYAASIGVHWWLNRSLF